MAEKKSSKKKKKPAVRPTPQLKMYRSIAVTFTLITFLLLAGVVYLSFSRALISVTPEEQDVQTHFIADVVLVPQDEHEIQGRVLSNLFEQAAEKTIEGSEGVETEGLAGGEVTIINTHSSDQPLIATTRLLTPDGILFRIDDTVLVPAGGTVQVTAHADQPGKDGDIGPTSFAIPGLNPTLQDLIYAESGDAMTGGLVVAKVVSEGDLDSAAEELEAEMVEGAKESLRLMAGGEFTGEAFFSEIVERRSDTPPGEESDTVNVSLKLRVVGVFFHHDDLVRLAEGKLYENVVEGMELTSMTNENLSFEVKEYNTEDELANIEVDATGFATLTPASPVLDKSEFVGKGPGVVKEALEAEDAIRTVNIRLTPFWLKHLPTLKDHIKIIIE